MNLQDAVIAMLKTEQSQGQSVYQHGFSVQQHFHELINNPINWKIPNWFFQYKEEIINSLHDLETINLYLLYHDIGKPVCKTIDEQGKVHFPNHAQVSKKTWLEIGGDPMIANLIGWDMILHTANASEIEQYLLIWSKQDACTLLLAALAELHSNAKMFGGFDTPSFKIKFKQIERRGNQICKFLFKENHVSAHSL
jgi:hypothetical protein